MAEAFTTTELLVSVRELCRASEDDPDATDAALLRAADRELRNRFVPLIRAARQDYYVVHADTDLVADQEAYDLPSRATTSSVRRVILLDSQGRPDRNLDPIPFADRFDYALKGDPINYTLQDDRLILLPTPSRSTGSVRVYYELRPSTLILPADAETMDVIDTTTAGEYRFTGTVTADNAWGDRVVDFVRAKPPFSSLIRDATVI